MSPKINQRLRQRRIPLVLSFTIITLIALAILTTQISARPMHQVPAAGNRAARVGYYAIDCPDDNSRKLYHVSPLPTSRYLYSETYGWFDTTHFESGDPDQLIEDIQMAAENGGGVIAITQPIRDGLTGYTAHYLISGDVATGDIMGVALGIYMDWSIRFESWQGGMPRGLVGPFTPFSIEDLPTQYLGFLEHATDMKLPELFTCYLGDVSSAENPPHIWLADESTPTDELIGLPTVERLTNEGFQPMVLTDSGWQLVHWPEELRLAPVPSSNITWLFEGEETWYLRQNMPE